MAGSGTDQTRSSPERATAKHWLEAALGFFYPPVCQVCGLARAAADDGYVCRGCQTGSEGVRWVEAPFCERCGLPAEGQVTIRHECANCSGLDLWFSRARSAVVANGLLLDVIHRYKYRRALWFEPFLAGLLIRQAGPALRDEPWDGLVPVPLHPLKRREREFNQAERLARRLGRAVDLPVWPGVVKRVRFTETQTALSRTDRMANTERAFVAANQDGIEGRRLVLIDDVLTTGATTNACARALRAAGAAEVAVWTVVRGQ